jgi:outer membrane lipoprotein-sorting protein
MQFLGGQITQLVLFDTLGQRVVVDFEALQLNGTPDPAEFSFRIPDGVDVLEDY